MRVNFCLPLCVLLLAAGCGGSADDASPASNSGAKNSAAKKDAGETKQAAKEAAGAKGGTKKAAPPEPIEIDPESLPPIGRYLPPLDDGRIEIGVPESWFVRPRSSQYLARFAAQERSAYPTIIVTAEDAPGVQELRGGKLMQYATDLNQQFTAGGSKLTEPVTPITIGNFQGVQYARVAATSGGKRLEVLTLITWHAERKYKLELQAFEGTLGEFPEYLHAVAAGIKFHPAGSEPEAAPGE